MTLPQIAIVGRPNVGKSSLLNRMARQHVSIVAPEPGVTRDRVSSVIEIDAPLNSPPGTAGKLVEIFAPGRGPVVVLTLKGFLTKHGGEGQLLAESEEKDRSLLEIQRLAAGVQLKAEGDALKALERLYGKAAGLPEETWGPLTRSAAPGDPEAVKAEAAAVLATIERQLGPIE